ncbi:MAG: YncE family protein [Bacteroidota bacterium]
MKRTLLFIGALLISTAIQAQNYYVWVAAESEDVIQRVHFDATTQTGTIDKTIDVGMIPTEIDGPHGMNVSLDGKYVFVSIAHGQPYGYLQKFDAETGILVEQANLGLFPASMEMSEATGFLYIVNFNLHGDMVPSTVSVVDPELMEVITEIPTGVMPHGSRLNEDGTRQYHVSMMTDELIELDTEEMKESRRLPLVSSGMDNDHSGMDHSKMNHSAMDHSTMNHDSDEKKDHSEHSGMDHGSKKHEGMMHHNPVVKPTWADPHPHKPLVYVAGNGSNEIIEIDIEQWNITRRFDTAKGPYNLEVSHDGKLLVVSYKGAGSTGVWDLETGTQLAEIPNSRKVTHGVTISPDNKYAFLSVEGIGGEPGSVDIIDLTNLTRADVVETGKQAGGITFWKQTD